jgi:DNA polymerase III sliding clamp (beta) subunit (PCNA family)
MADKMKYYYYYHAESDTLWSSNRDYEHEGNPDGCTEPITRTQALRIQEEQQIENIPHFEHKEKHMKKIDLLNALEIVKPGLASREVIEQTNAFAFMNGRVVTYNDEISLSHPVEGLTITGAVKAEELYQLLRKIKKDEIVIDVNNNEITLNAGKAKAGLVLQSEIKLPLEEVDTHGDWHKLPEGFIKPLRFAMAACTRDNSQPVLTNVHVNKKGFVEGSDNFRMTRYTLAKRMPVETFLIPATSVRELIKLNPVEIAEGEGWVHFRTAGDTVLSCRVTADAYPDTEQFLNVEGSEITFPKTIIDILERAEVFAKGDGAEEVSISMEKSRITVHSKSETGWYKEEASTNYEGDAIEFTIVPYLLKDILSETQVCIYNGDVLMFAGENWVYVSAVIAKA